MVTLAVWSGPRNLSTALMRSWENRQDTTVLDEPLYAHYLWRTGLDHPGRDDILAAGPVSEQEAIAACQAEGSTPVVYQKHMTHHLLESVQSGFAQGFTNVLLLRHPARVLASYAKVRNSPTLADIGVPQQQRLFDELSSAGMPPPIIDADDFLRNPEGYLRFMCSQLSVEFDSAMLQWPAGSRDSDGVWAKHWYAAVEASTSFATPPDSAPSRDELAQEVLSVLDEAMGFYTDMWHRREIM